MAKVSFDRGPDNYRHWRLRVEPPIAWLELDVDPDGGIVPGYQLKLNSYDLGVDIELHDAVQRLRFEHPEVRAVVITSAQENVFSAGANIQMLAASSHAWKVNFCKFTNETRNAIEDATANSGQIYLAAVNGSCAGGGYEIALACERILLVDDNSSTVALPEVPLLGVLPATGGLTRLVDKRKVRRDRADVFATRPDGMKGRAAVDWRLVDELVPRQGFREEVARRAREIAAGSDRPEDAQGIELTPLNRTETETSVEYTYVAAKLDRVLGAVTITVRGTGERDWPLIMTRELDDLILRLRTNEPELGIWLLRTEGDAEAVLAGERELLSGKDWLSNEIRHFYKRTLKRLDVTSRSLIALIEPGSCFAGMLLELALACDRQYMLDNSEDESGDENAAIVLSDANFGAFPMGNGLSRMESRFYAEPEHIDRLKRRRDQSLSPADAMRLGLVTAAPDDLDWDDEIRIMLEGRAALSPDALTGMEANHRFVGPETVETKIFGRLSAWQNWIFTRPNAAGLQGALRRYGTGQKATFDRGRV